MTIPTTRERIDYGGDDGCALYGNAREVIVGWTTGRVLKKSESGALVIFNTAAGQAITLPVIASRDVGMFFDFLITVTGTGTYQINTDGAATFIIGAIDSSSTAVAEGGDTFVADGATHVNVVFDADTTGRLVGTSVRLTAISTTLWAISGTMMGVGTLATPF
jgi:hypothetical protein